MSEGWMGKYPGVIPIPGWSKRPSSIDRLDLGRFPTSRGIPQLAGIGPGDLGLFLYVLSGYGWANVMGFRAFRSEPQQLDGFRVLLLRFWFWICKWRNGKGNWLETGVQSASAHTKPTRVVQMALWFAGA